MSKMDINIVVSTSCTLKEFELNLENLENLANRSSEWRYRWAIG